MMQLDSILFDLDGTLWDSVAGVSQAWQSVIDRYPGLREPITDAEIADCMGFGLTEISGKLFPGMDSALREQVLKECLTAEYQYLREHGGRLYAGVEETLAYLARRFQLAIVSNCEEGYIECFFEVTGLGKYFSDYESMGRTGREKGENILLVMERLGSKKAIYIGDMIKDSEAAAFARIPYVYARYGFGKGKLKPRSFDYAIDSISELIAIIEK